MRAPRNCFDLIAFVVVGLAVATGAAADSLDPIVAAMRAREVRPATESLLREEAAWLASQLSAGELVDLAAGRITLEEAIAGLGARRGHVDTADLRTVTAAALGDFRSDLVFVPVAPCRVIDTRIPGVALAAGTPQNFVIVGTSGFEAQGGKAGGCGIPTGTSTSPSAAAVAVNFVVVGASGPGNLRAWEFGQPIPDASVVNYTNVPGLNIANGVIVPIAGTSTASFDLSVRADVSSTHLVADVTGFFKRTVIPLGPFSSSTGTVDLDLSDGTCKEVFACTLPLNQRSTVRVDASMLVAVNHLTGQLDTALVNIETTSPVTCPASATSEQLQIGDAWPADLVTTSVPIQQVFFSQEPGTRTYRLSVRMTGGASVGDVVKTARLFCDATLR